MIRHISLIFVFTLASSLSLADTSTADYGHKTTAAETTGVLGGATLGALAGGPLGMIGGAAIGALLGDGWNSKQQVGDLQASLYESQLRLAMLQDEADKLKRDLASSREVTTASGARIIPAAIESPITRICCDNTIVSLHFRSGSSGIESHEEEILNSFARLSEQLPDPTIEITGYADRNGDAQANLRLSQRRSEAVRDYLALMGIKNSTITTIAYGEEKPLQASQSLESDFFDRRVVLRLRDASQLMLTQGGSGR